MRKRVALAVALASSSGFGLLAGCADLFGFKDLHETETSVPDVSVPDTGVDVDTCAHATWPDPPDANDPGTSNNYTLAVRHVYFTTSADGGTASFGYDLDHRCTTDLASASCQSANATVDTPMSVDNESIQLMNTLVGLQPSLTSSLSDQSINDAIAVGGFTLMVRLFGLRGVANQPSTTGLTASIQASPGVESAPPQWDGNDRWLVSADDVLGGLDGGTNFPKVVIPAFVKDGELVAPYTGTITLRVLLPSGNTISGPLAVTLNRPVFSAKLVKRADQQYDLTDGIVAGRWAASDMLRAIASLDLNGSALCTYIGGTVYQLVAQTICGQRDITSTGIDDDTASCDSISVAIAFDAVSSQIANVPSAFPTSSTPCADAGLCGD